MSDVSSVSDVVNKVQQFDLDFIRIARENVGVFMSVSYIALYSIAIVYRCECFVVNRANALVFSLLFSCLHSGD